MANTLAPSSVSVTHVIKFTEMTGICYFFIYLNVLAQNLLDNIEFDQNLQRRWLKMARSTLLRFTTLKSDVACFSFTSFRYYIHSVAPLGFSAKLALFFFRGNLALALSSGVATLTGRRVTHVGSRSYLYLITNEVMHCIPQ